MPHWCSNMHVFYTESEDRSELLRLHRNLTSILETPSEVKNDFEPGWLGKVVIKHGLDWENVSCRGFITDLCDYDPKSNFFALHSETAWAPIDEIWEAVIDHYPGVSFVYLAEECSEDIYVNTDATGTYIPDRFKFELCGDAPIPEGWYTNQEKPNYIEVYEYFPDFEKLAAYCLELTGKVFTAFKELKDYFIDIFEDEGDVVVCVKEFTLS